MVFQQSRPLGDYNVKPEGLTNQKTDETDECEANSSANTHQRSQYTKEAIFPVASDELNKIKDTN